MSDPPDALLRRKRLRWGLAGFVTGFALLILLLGASGATFAGIARTLSSLSWPTYAAIAVVQSAIVLLAAIKWRIVLAETLDGQSVPIGAATAATATGALFGQVISIQLSVPIVRAWTARKHGISARAAAGTSLFEQMLELLTLALAALASIVLAAFGYVVAGLVLLVLLIAGTLSLKPLLGLGAKITQRLVPSGKLGAVLDSLAEGLRKAAAQRSKVLNQLMGLSLLRYALITALNIGVSMLLLPGLDPLPLIAAFPLILLVTSLPFLPAGLGIAEVTWASAFLLQGIDGAAAAEAAVALRVITIGGFLMAYPILAFLGHRSFQKL